MYGRDPEVVSRSKTKFRDPLKWKEPRFVFTCSWSDWFIQEADPWRAEANAIIAATPHTYQVLTKRIERAERRLPIVALPNMWLGVSIENKATLHRADVLRDLPAALRFLSLEPLLEDLGTINLRGIGWVIVGGESGSVRPFSFEWARSIIEQCKEAGVPVFMKQAGAFPVTGSSQFELVQLQDRKKGANPAEWPEGLRIRQTPPRYEAKLPLFA